MKRLIPVVNDRDEVIEYKDFNDLNDDDTWRVSTLWLENQHGEVLIAQRKLDKRIQPGKWGAAVAGTVEKGETYESNIYKEAEEEIGLSGVKFTKANKIYIKSPLGWRFFQGYKVKVSWPIEMFKIQTTEVEKLAYVPRNVLLQEIKDNPSKYIFEAQKFKELFDLE